MEQVELVVRTAVNAAALDESLREALGAAYAGLSLSGERLVLHFAAGTEAATLDSGRAIVLAHDPARLSQRQAAEQARAARLAAARQQRGQAIDPADYSADPLLLRLAYQVAWLAAEIDDVRGG